MSCPDTDTLDTDQRQQSLDFPLEGASVDHGTSSCAGKASHLKEKLRHRILKRRTEAGEPDIEVDLTSVPDYQMTEEDMDRRERRKEQNRRAARKCRAKKKSLEEIALQKYEEELERKKSLQADIAALQKHADDLCNVLRTHETASCRFPRPISAMTQALAPPAAPATEIQGTDLKGRSDCSQPLGHHQLYVSEHRQWKSVEQQEESSSLQQQQQPENFLTMSGHQSYQLQQQQQQNFFLVPGQLQPQQQQQPREEGKFITAPQFPKQEEGFLSGPRQQQQLQENFLLGHQQPYHPQDGLQQQQENFLQLNPQHGDFLSRYEQLQEQKDYALSIPWQHQQQNQDDDFPSVLHQQSQQQHQQQLQQQDTEIQHPQQQAHPGQIQHYHQQHQGQQSWITAPQRTPSHPTYLSDIAHSTDARQLTTSTVSATVRGANVPSHPTSLIPTASPGWLVSSHRSPAPATMVKPAAPSPAFRFSSTAVDSDPPCTGFPTAPRPSPDVDGPRMVPSHSATLHQSPSTSGGSYSSAPPLMTTSSTSSPFLHENSGSLSLPLRSSSTHSLTSPSPSCSGLRGMGESETPVQVFCQDEADMEYKPVSELPVDFELSLAEPWQDDHLNSVLTSEFLEYLEKT